MELNLESLSVEDLKVLRTNINLLLKDKCKPKYKENTYFIKSDDLFFSIVNQDCINDNIRYRLNVNTSNGDNYFYHVDESYIDECLMISDETYNSLLSYKNEFLNKLTEFRNDLIDKIYDYKKSLSKEFKHNLQEIINELNKS